MAFPPSNRIVIGESIEGRPQEVFRFGRGPVNKLIVAGIHGGSEWNTVQLAGQLIAYLNDHPERIPQDTSLYILADLNPDRVQRIETRANESIAAGAPVTVRILPRDEAFAIPDLIRTKINLLPPGIAEVRVVSIGELDTQADGGTHVADAREVGGIRIVGTRSKGKINKRLEVVVEDQVP